LERDAFLGVEGLRRGMDPVGVLLSCDEVSEVRWKLHGLKLRAKCILVVERFWFFLI
jgi:hypothetical protein